MKPAVIAIDLGGTKTAVALVDRQGSIIWQQVTPTPAERGAAAILYCMGQMTRKARQSEPTYRVGGIGLATPGQIDYTRGRIAFATDKLKGWTGTHVVERLSQATGLPVAMDNDGNLAALGEWTYGTTPDLPDMICMTVGTGIGGGIISSGTLIRGASGAAGAFGHISVDPSGPSCYCGGRGCVELYASGRALSKQVQAAVAEGRWMPPYELEGDGVPTLVKAALAGDPFAVDLVARSGALLGEALVPVINTLNPALVVVGGGISVAGALLLDPLKQAVLASVPEARRIVKVCRATLQEKASLLGAAALAWKHLETLS